MQENGRYGLHREPFYWVEKTILSAAGYISPRYGTATRVTASDKMFLVLLLDYFSGAPDEPWRIPQSEIAHLMGTEVKTTMRSVAKFIEDNVLVAVKEGVSWVYYGVNDILVTNSSGEESIVKGSFCKKPVPEKADTEEEENPNNGIYYVYVCKLKGEPVYVGKGKHSRISHCLSGASSNANLNRLVFEHREDQFEVSRVIDGVSEEYALLKEREIIDSLTVLGYDLCNKTGDTK